MSEWDLGCGGEEDARSVETERILAAGMGNEMNLSVDHPRRVHLSIDEIEARRDAAKQAFDCSSTGRDHQPWHVGDGRTVEAPAAQSLSNFSVHVKMSQRRLKQLY
jgi:hypothetical protein